MIIPCAIEWNPVIDLFSIGALRVRYYSLWWLIGLAAAYFILQHLYKRQGLSGQNFEKLIIYGFIGIVAGARLGHCLFYEPGYFLAHPLEIILPFGTDANGNYTFTGYLGLASHGGTIGLMIALWLYSRKTHIDMWQTLDNIAIATPIAACCIRIGNFWNSEIIGCATNSDWGIIFSQVDNIPRHPAQLYEAIAYLLIFIGGYLLYKYKGKELHRGFFFGYCLTTIFAFRFVVEFVKENQELFEETMLFNMGQLLSIPFIILGLICLLYKGIGKIKLTGTPARPHKK